MVKISDIAKATGYSTTTVSKAFNNYTDISDKARLKIRKIADEMGYIPNTQARGLVMKRSFTIGVILDEILDLGLTHPFFAEIVQSFREAVEENGYSMVLISNNIGNSNVESYISHCRQINVDAVFILCTNKDAPNIQELIHSKIPTVLFDILDDETHGVMSDHYQGGRLACEYLIKLGHTRIGHIYGNEHTLAGKDRKRAYYDVMEEYGLRVNEEHVKSGGYFDFESGKLAMEAILKAEERPSAVFVAGDLMALGAIQACYENNIAVPAQLSIIAFDNIKMLNWITPALTTVAQNYNALAHLCCEILISVIENKEMELCHKVLPTYIVERSSCASIESDYLQ